MESHINNNEKVDGVVVYIRKKKRTTSEATPLESKACKGKVDKHADKPERVVEENRGDNGGTFIFCEACSNSYHPQCLTPPLVTIPDGDWQCPNCSNNDDFPKLIRNFKKHKKENNSLCSNAKKKIKLSEDEAVKSKSPKSSSPDKPSATAESNTSEVGIIKQHTLNKVKMDKLLLLRKNSEACIGSMPELLNTDKEKATMQQPDPVTKKEKYVQLRQRQKEKVALKDKNKEPLSSSRPFTPKQSSDLQRVNYDELIALNALTSWKGVDTPGTSCMGQDMTTPNPSSHLKNDSTSGFTWRPENIDTTASRRSSRFWNFEHNKDGWSEMEIDVLWLAVRRYGQGNWEAILADPSMRLLKNKSPEDLATKWDKETSKVFPSAIPLPVSTVFSPSIPHALSGTNGYSFAHPPLTQFNSPMFPSHVSGSGIQRLFPVGVENQSLMRVWSMPYLNSGILGSYNQGPSSIFLHPIQRVANTPLRASNGNLNPTFTQLMFQTLNQNSNMRVQALQTPAQAVFTTRHSSTNA